MKLKLLALAAAILASAPASAASLIVSGGKLTGATGITVGNGIYDVAFLDGTCAELFSGCDSQSDLNFTNLADGTLAGSALLDQVLLGQFDTDYTQTFGCDFNGGGWCGIVIPYQVREGGGFLGNLVLNYNLETRDNVGGVSAGPGFGSSGDLLTFASFTRTGDVVSPVPEPTTWMMMLFGFGALGHSLRRRAKRYSLAQAS